MSLISDALKKAQRMRTGESLPPMAVDGGGGQVLRRAQPQSAQSLVWIVAGAVGLVVVAVIATVFFLRPKSEPPPAPAVAQAPAAPPAGNVTTESPAQITIAPIRIAAVPAEPAPAEARVESAPSPVRAAAEPSGPPVQAEPAPAPGPKSNPSAAATAKSDPRVQAFVDAIKVTGIRSSGADSKVLMNDRVFRVNDIVDRMLGVRLTEVQADSLTFVDENGVAYIKSF